MTQSTTFVAGTVVTKEWLNAVDEHVFNVQRYGAVGDGVTDDSAAIQAAEDAASVAGTTVRFPAGVYLCSSVVYRRGNTDWVGEGIYQTIIKHSGGTATHHLIHTEDADIEYSNIGFYNMAFDGNRSGSTDPNVDRLVVFLDRNSSGGTEAPSSDVRFVGCRLFNFSYGNMGLHIKGYTGVTVKSSFFTDGGGQILYHPIYIRRCADVLVEGNTVTGRDSNTCIKVQLSPRSTISSNICKSGGRGITAQDAEQYTITGNVCTDSTDEGIAVTIETASECLEVSVTGNAIYNAATSILVSNVVHFTMTGNVCTEFTEYGLRFRAARDGTCTGNTLRTADSLGGDITFIMFEAGPTASRMVCGSNWLRNIRPGGVTNAITTDEVTTTGLALFGNRLFGTFTAEYTGINTLIDLPEPGQIKFPSTQNASTNVNTLDDYVEGTFTPTIVGSTSAGTGTYTTQVARYSKIGRRVFFQARIVWTAHTGTGNLRMGALPYTSNSVADSYSGVNLGECSDITLTASNVMTAYIPSNNTQVLFLQYPVGGGTSSAVAINTAGSITVSGHYEATA